ncbi:MAG: hypothetical protein A2Y48_05480 [Nitrospirae bacterium RIFCSPLOW2_12_42_9]|nr:MAG: hypothetical protein A2035_03945 [Nitrospirae bacterium GWA2_42_11]OGW56686.1 MAG: hypothetical protein A2Y48_05480 [Nitrospirae bacterium RIFCSPLOW2_12_42_9]
MDELRNKETMLQRLSEAYKNIIDMSLDTIISMDESGQITLYNKAAERMFGHSQHNAIGMSLTELIPEEYRERHVMGLKRFIETGEHVLIGKTIEVEGLRKDGSRFPQELSLSAVKFEDRWVFTGIIRDITERKKAEETLRQRIGELEQFKKAAIHRELRIKELKERLNKLEKALHA